MIGNNIYKLRKQKGLTLSELAERTGISKSYLSNIERNLKQNPSIHVMEKIASVLKVDLKVLLKLAAEAESKQQLDKEWLDFISDLQKSGMDREKLREFKILLDFMNWYKEKSQNR